MSESVIKAEGDQNFKVLDAEQIHAMPNAEGADPVPLRNQDYIFTLGLYF